MSHLVHAELPCDKRKAVLESTGGVKPLVRTGSSVSALIAVLDATDRCMKMGLVTMIRRIEMPLARGLSERYGPRGPAPKQGIGKTKFVGKSTAARKTQLVALTMPPTCP